MRKVRVSEVCGLHRDTEINILVEYHILAGTYAAIGAVGVKGYDLVYTSERRCVGVPY